MENWLKLALLCICLICHGVTTVEAGRKTLSDDPNSFSVLDFGAKANPATDDTQAFVDTWNAACGAMGDVKMVVPKGSYFLSQLKFYGPCPVTTSVTFQLEGTLLATTDLSKFEDGQGWVEFGWVNKLIVTGGGTFDGQGAQAWPLNECPKKKDCKLLPSSIKFITMNDTLVKGITSLNPKLFHIGVINCNNFEMSNLKIKAPADSPNTDGMHLENCVGVTVSNTEIGTGDDCISIGQGNHDVTISSITCGPGHGISIGSLGRYETEKDVQGITVRDCTFVETMTGVRIKTWANSAVSIRASDMTFENLVMKDVQSPIIIDQSYCPYVNCDNSKPSTVQLSNIRFNNIHGTSTLPEAVKLHCSQGVPCQNVTLNDIDLKHSANEIVKTICLNAVTAFTGTMNPPACTDGAV